MATDEDFDDMQSFDFNIVIVEPGHCLQETLQATPLRIRTRPLDGLLPKAPLALSTVAIQWRHELSRRYRKEVCLHAV